MIFYLFFIVIVLMTMFVIYSLIRLSSKVSRMEELNFKKK